MECTENNDKNLISYIIPFSLFLSHNTVEKVEYERLSVGTQGVNFPQFIFYINIKN